MITHADQLELFRLISEKLSRDVECYAFGGTAMMFYGYKDETKDIDLVFKNNQDLQEFIRALSLMGFEKTSPFTIYIKKKAEDPNAPLMYTQEDTRFDLFSEHIFRAVISPKMKEDVYAKHEFVGAHKLTVTIFREEVIIMLKSLTERERDLEDIKNIVKNSKRIDWQYIVDEVVWQYEHGDRWTLYDIEKNMRELKKEFFIEKKYLDQLYAAVENGEKKQKKEKEKSEKNRRKPEKEDKKNARKRKQREKKGKAKAI